MSDNDKSLTIRISPRTFGFALATAAAGKMVLGGGLFGLSLEKTVTWGAFGIGALTAIALMLGLVYLGALGLKKAYDHATVSPVEEVEEEVMD